jgi:pilus assembly protein CpaB
MLIIAIVLAGGAAWIANRWVESQTNVASSTQANTVAVVVAATNIPFGSRIEATQIKLIEWPKSSVPEHAFYELQPLVGKVTQRSFISNEILLKPFIKEHLGGSTLSALITEGMRAMSVRVNDIVGVAGFILPGNKVDIIHVKGKGKLTYTLLHNIKVLAIDQTASTDQNKPAVVRALTLEVSPKHSEKLVKAMKTGSLQFTLRNPLDDEELIKEKEAVKSKKKVRRKIRRPAPESSITVLPWKSKVEKKCKAKVC